MYLNTQNISDSVGNISWLIVTWDVFELNVSKIHKKTIKRLIVTWDVFEY